jgi:alpha-beta hydrolase superfamily lysophospholipase
MTRRAFLACSLGLSAGLAGLAFASAGARSIASPLPGHRTLDLDLVDADRRRPVPARLYLPRQASPAQPVPLVVFSHGLGGSRMGYSYLATHWADEGIASLHPQHIGSDSAVWRGNPLELVQRLQSAATDAEAHARVLDLRHALDHVLASDQAPLIDAARIAVAGHSYGANTAMLVAGARVATADSDRTDLRDKRIQAAILISAPPLMDQGPVEQVLGAVSIPTLHITSLEDTIKLPGYRSTVADRIAIFDAMTRSPKALAVFNTGGHSIFTDRTTISGPETSARIKGATRELCTVFLRRSLRTPFTLPDTQDEAREIRQWLGRYQDVLDRFVMPWVFRGNATAESGGT